MRKTMRRSSGTPALRSTIAFWTSMAQRTASTTLRNSTMLPSPGALDDAPMVDRDGRIDQIAAQRPQSRQDAILVRAGEPAVADHIRAKDRRQFSGLAHRARPPPCQTSTKTRQKPSYLT